MVVDFRKNIQFDHSPLNINGSSVEIIKNTKFLGVHLQENLTCFLNTSSITGDPAPSSHHPSSPLSTKRLIRGS